MKKPRFLEWATQLQNRSGATVVMASPKSLFFRRGRTGCSTERQHKQLKFRVEFRRWHNGITPVFSGTR